MTKHLLQKLADLHFEEGYDWQTIEQAVAMTPASNPTESVVLEKGEEHDA